MLRNLQDTEGLFQVLATYFAPETIRTASPVVGGGFSGAKLWRISSNLGEFCFRRWPAESPTEDRLVAIHRVLFEVGYRGVREVAVPILNRAGKSFVAAKSHLWEVSPWMPGEANYHFAPSTEKLQSALRLLARFHLAASEAGPRTIGPPPGLVARLQQLRRLRSTDLPQLLAAVNSTIWPETQETATKALAYFPRHAPRLEQMLETTSRYCVPLQPCIRDIWHEHVLFTGNHVSGLIDFGAMREDHVAADLSRLLGSFVGDDAGGWQMGLAVYESLRPLQDREQELVIAYDRSGILLSAMNWLRWLYVERRVFDDRTRVQHRLASIVERLERLDW